MSDEIKYYHGGYGNLKAGDFILPSTKTKSKSCAEYGAESVCRRDRVYVTTDVFAAIMYASFFWRWGGPGRVYEVEPQGEMCHDTDCTEEGLSFECDRAKILRIVPVPLMTKSQMEAFIAHESK